MPRYNIMMSSTTIQYSIGRAPPEAAVLGAPGAPRAPGAADGLGH